ncbi:hypothetical protein ES677_14640 [Bizionia gelidisalsuginis]|uniref:Lipoprotein n=2 Tax=Bizionia TaxID=283785 RepID=A0A8H2LB02_9FLAO|nr:MULTISPECIES: DUF6567 family protein [Bizionia]TYB69065.1 hypothetical protein ES676_14340 [Bizionia saleffrena]TYC08156.1 hypothetical protein ES677_14640 [Bizionia gelidisalsuginis]
MKKIILSLAIVSLFASCRSSLNYGGYNQINQTQTVLSSSNFNVLGSFKGIATEKIVTGNITNKEGIISQAKTKLLENARAAGVELIGSRTLVNVAVDLIETKKRISVTISAEIIEFK